MFRPPVPAKSRPIATLTVVFRILGLWTFCFWAWGASDLAAQPLTQRLTGSPRVPWQISADAVDYDPQSATYHATGNVIIEKEATRLVADRVSFNHRAMTASAAGHVVMTVGGDVLTGDRLDLDLDQQTGVVHDGLLFLEQNHFYIRGERIEKTGPDTYRAHGAALTSCDGERPDWVITARTVSVTVEGYGRASHAVFRAGDVPVFYTPYLLFPAKTNRQTGLLIPEAGYSSRKGYYWDQPLFWAINDSSDATLLVHPMQERGTAVGLEYRYARTGTAYGTIMADGLQDRQVDDGTPDATRQWGYDGDAYDRPNRDRYWLRAKADQDLPWGAMARLDLDVVSDQDYLSEFRDGRSGFNATRDAFLNRFGRDLETYDQSTRTNRLNINRTWSRYVWNSDLRWRDNVTSRRWEPSDTTLQNLPAIAFSGLKQPLFGSDLYWDLGSGYTYFYREDGERGHRMDLYPRAYLPLRWKNYLSLEPSAGWRQTAWVMDRWESDTLDRSSYRQIYDARLDLSSEFSRVMGSSVAGVDRIRHSVTPEVSYTYIPDQDQSDLPYFTVVDRIAAVNRVTYSLTNLFTARRPKPAPAAGASGGVRAAVPEGTPHVHQTDGPIAPAFDYDRFCRFYLRQSYDIAAARDDEPQPFSDIYGELQFSLGRYLRLDSDASYDTYASRFSSHYLGAAVADRRGNRLQVVHRYSHSLNESIRGTLSLRLSDRLTVRGEYERNLLDDLDIVKGAGLLYTAQCWSVDFYYAVEGDDNRFAFLIDLLGIGGFGK